jgi:predicted phage terminase large subunit-like protein
MTEPVPDNLPKRTPRTEPNDSDNSPEIPHGTTSVTLEKEELLNDFFKFTIVVLGYLVMPFHYRWARFQMSRKRSLVLAPRDHGKSIILTIAYLVWRIVKNPNIRILIVSNSATTAQKFLEAIKSHFEKNTTLIALFGDYTSKRWNTEAITVSTRTAIGYKEPTCSTVGVYGSIVSGHFDLIMCDDLVDFENARSKEGRDKLWSWLWTVLMPTLETSETDPDKDGEIHFIGTRYDDDDLYGRGIAAPTVTTRQDGTVETDNAGFLRNCFMRDGALVNMGGREANYTSEGKAIEIRYDKPDTIRALWPERKSVTRLLQTRIDAGSVIYEMQYQNNAELAKGRIFKRYHFNGTWKHLPANCLLYLGVDLAVSKKTSADYFCVCLIAVSPEKIVYIIDIWRDKISAPKQFTAIKAEYAKHRFAKCGVESVAYQEAMVQWLSENSDVPVVGVPRNSDKVIRACGIQGHIENGRVLLPEGRDLSWFVDEMCMFPEGVHDDGFDALETAMDIGLNSSRFQFQFAS